MEVVDETWYKELKDTDAFYTNVTALKLLDHLNKFCSGLHTIDAVDIPQLMKRSSLTPMQSHSSSIPWQRHSKNPSGQTCHTGQVYAQCGAEIATTVK